MQVDRILRMSALVLLVACDGGEDAKDVVDTGPTEIPDRLVRPEVAIEPFEALTTDDLVAVIQEPDEALTYTFQWSQDGVERTDLTTDTVPASLTVKGEEWSVEVRSSNGTETSDPGEATVEVRNAAPTIAVELEPNPASSDQDIQVRVVGQDLDGDPVSVVRYRWFKDGGIAAPSGDVLSAVSTRRDEVWRVEVTPTDGEDEGEAGVAEVTITNGVPVVTAATLDPPNPTELSVLTPGVSTRDADGDAIAALRIEWIVGGPRLPPVDGTIAEPPTLDGASFDKGDLVTFRAQVSDGLDWSDWFSGPQVIVGNSPPTLTAAEVSPDPAFEADRLSCDPVGFADVDGDAPFYTYRWFDDGVPILGATQATLTGDDFDRGSPIACGLVASDGTATLPEVVSDEVVISNSPPTLGGAALSTTTPGTTDTLSVSPIDPFDPDGDPIVYDVAWYVDGVFRLTAGSYTQPMLPGQQIFARVTPTDGITPGVPVDSDVAFVGNELPVATSVVIAPASPRTLDALTATAMGTDGDGHLITWTYVWYERGVEIQRGPSNVLPSDATTKGDRISVEAIPFDGFDSGISLTSAPVEIRNSAPSLGTVDLSPTEAFEDTVLTCTASGWSDADEDPAGFLYRWEIDRAPVSGATGPQLSGSSFDRGDAVRCLVTPFDGTDGGTEITSSTVTIGNTPPDLVDVRLSSTTPSVGDTLFVTPVGPSDLDGDGVSYRYAWYVEGAYVADTESFSTAGLSPFETVYVTVTPTDGTDDGDPVDSPLAVLQNTSPSVIGVALDPLSPTTVDPITVSYTADDPDGDPLTVSIRWYVDFVHEPAADDLDTLDPSLTERDDVITVEVTADDGTTTSPLALGGPVVVVNSQPTLDAVALGPDPAFEGDTLTCTPGTAADPDAGDTVVFRYSWEEGGAPLPGATAATLSSARFEKGDVVRCVVRPDDGGPQGPGDGVRSPEVQIRNTPPVLTSLQIEPADPVETTLITPVAEVEDDADGDEVTLRFDWTVVDGATGLETLITDRASLDGTHFDRGDTVRLTATPDDGEELGAPVTAADVVVANSPPEVLSVTLGPDSPGIGDDIEADVIAVDEDPVDDAALSLHYDFAIDGTSVQAGPSPVLPASFTAADDLITVTVVATDLLGVASEPLTSLTLRIGNSTPSITGVRIEPSAPSKLAPPSCVPEGWSDADGDPEGYEFLWFKNGSGTAFAGLQTLLPAQYVRGDDLVCRATPYDGTSRGTPLDSASVEVVNAPPTADAVALSSDTVTERTVLGVVVTRAVDPDGDGIATTVDWSVNGAFVRTAETLTGADFDRGDVITAVVRLTDGIDDNTYPAGPATVTNARPRVENLVIGPPEPAAADDVTLVYDLVDLDGDPVTSSVTWFVDTLVVEDVDGDVLPADRFRRDQAVYAVVLPNDGIEDGPPVTSDEVVAINTAPSITGVAVTPDPVTREVTAQCAPEGASDVDGDTVAFRYRWTVNGTTALRSPTLTADYFERGDEIECFVTPTDLSADGVTLGSGPIPVENSPPRIAAVQLNDTDPAEGEILTATVVGPTDADFGDVITFDYAWFVGPAGSMTVVSTTPQLDSGLFVRGDSIRLDVTPSDGIDDGPTVSSATVVAGNTPPRITVDPFITPELPKTVDDLVAVVEGTDDDGDPVTFEFTWIDFDTGAVLQQGASDTLPASLTAKGMTIDLDVRPFDGLVYGPVRSASAVFVANSLPSPPSVALEPEPVRDGRPLTCRITAPATDDDGDPLTYTFRWLRDGGAYSGATTAGDGLSSTVPGADVRFGERLQCTASASDDQGTGGASAPAFTQVHPASYASCLDIQAYFTESGVYPIDSDGPGGFPEHDVYCDLDLEGGGWARIIRTVGNNEDYGQNTSAIVSPGAYVGVTAPSGVYDAFRYYETFDDVLILAVNGPQAGKYASFRLTPQTVVGLSMLEVLETCRDETATPGDDAAFPSPRAVGHTAVNSGPVQATGGSNLQLWDADTGLAEPVGYVFVCGVNRESDNDVSYLTFTNAWGTIGNGWGDRWRGVGQVDTIWSFANGNYTTGDGHIGNGTLDAFAGWKGVGRGAAEANHNATYEIYIR